METVAESTHLVRSNRSNQTLFGHFCSFFPHLSVLHFLHLALGIWGSQAQQLWLPWPLFSGPSHSGHTQDSTLLVDRNQEWRNTVARVHKTEPIDNPIHFGPDTQHPLWPAFFIGPGLAQALGQGQAMGLSHFHPKPEPYRTLHFGPDPQHLLLAASFSGPGPAQALTQEPALRICHFPVQTSLGKGNPVKNTNVLVPRLLSTLKFN